MKKLLVVTSLVVGLGFFAVAPAIAETPDPTVGYQTENNTVAPTMETPKSPTLIIPKKPPKPFCPIGPHDSDDYEGPKPSCPTTTKPPSQTPSETPSETTSETPSQTPSTTPSQTPSKTPSQTPSTPAETPKYTCEDFDSREQAQAEYDRQRARGVYLYDLDEDRDGIVCEPVAILIPKADNDALPVTGIAVAGIAMFGAAALAMGIAARWLSREPKELD
jgi:hypothetical protein